MKGASPPSTPLLNDLFFDYKKATQALNFFALKEGGTINKMKALKLIYFAERYHLRKYGRPVTNDDYWAMGLGTVPSGSRDISHLKSGHCYSFHY